MIIHSVKDLSNSVAVNLLKKEFSKISDETILANYHPDFESVPGNFFRILNEGRYSIGNYLVMEEDGKYFGSAGWNDYEGIALILTRAFVPKELRGRFNMAKYLLPVMFSETENYNRLWITCNDYNFTIYQALTRLSQGKASTPWPDVYKKFVPIGKKIVYYTEQYVAEYKR
jgi:hypothetical protein